MPAAKDGEPRDGGRSHAGLSAEGVAPVLNTKDKDILVHNDEDDAVLSDTVLAEACELAGEEGEAFGICREIRVDSVQNAFGVPSADPLKIARDRLLEGDPIRQGSSSCPQS